MNTYVIKPNDNCDSIAAAFGIATSTLLSNNPNVLDDCSTIYLNEVIDSFLSLLNVYLIHHLYNTQVLCVDKVLVGYSTP